MALEQDIEGYEEYVKQKEKADFFTKLTPNNIIIILGIFTAILVVLAYLKIDLKYILTMIAAGLVLFFLMSKIEPTQKIIPLTKQISRLNGLMEWQQAMGIIPKGALRIVRNFSRVRRDNKVDKDWFHVVLFKYPSWRKVDLIYTFDPNESGAGVLSCYEYPGGWPDNRELLDVKVPGNFLRMLKLLQTSNKRGLTQLPFDTGSKEGSS